MKTITFLIFLSFLLLGYSPSQRITLHLMGDSTCAIKAERKRPETGWGEKLAQFFNNYVTVKNYAQNGRSTRTFIEEHRWDSVCNSLKSGDYVLIQFGHNDEMPEKTSYTSPEEFANNLKRFVSETRLKGAVPVLLTPICRRRFTDGNFYDTHGKYSAIVRKVAKETDAALIDMHTISMAILVQYGEDESAKLFLHCTAGDCQNYPKGIEDNTHLNDIGATVMAEALSKAIANQDIILKSHLIILRKNDNNKKQ